MLEKVRAILENYNMRWWWWQQKQVFPRFLVFKCPTTTSDLKHSTVQTDSCNF
jgi:hypothetical protein